MRKERKYGIFVWEERGTLCEWGTWYVCKRGTWNGHMDKRRCITGICVNVRTPHGSQRTAHPCSLHCHPFPTVHGRRSSFSKIHVQGNGRGLRKHWAQTGLHSSYACNECIPTIAITHNQPMPLYTHINAYQIHQGPCQCPRNLKDKEKRSFAAKNSKFSGLKKEELVKRLRCPSRSMFQVDRRDALWCCPPFLYACAAALSTVCRSCLLPQQRLGDGVCSCTVLHWLEGSQLFLNCLRTVYCKWVLFSKINFTTSSNDDTVNVMQVVHSHCKKSAKSHCRQWALCV